MENGKQKLGLRLAAGFLAGILIIVAVFASGVTFPGVENNSQLGSNQGRLTILLMDAPVEADELWITISGISVHKVGSEQDQTEAEIDEENGGWIDIDLSGATEEDLTFDLLKYQMGEENSVVLKVAEGDTATGTYNKIRLNVTQATAKYYGHDESGEVKMEEDEPVIEEEKDLKVPPEHIDVITKFTIEEQDTIVVLIDMQPNWISINKNNVLRPVMKASVFQELPDIEIETLETNEGEQTT